MENNKKASPFVGNDRGSSKSDENKCTESSRILKGLEEEFTTSNESDNPVPIDVLPPQFQNLISELDTSFKFLPDYSMAGLLYTVSTVLGNKVRLYVKNEWVEQARIYIVIVGLPGDGKSHAIKFMLKPLEEMDKEAYELYLNQLKDYHQNKDENKVKPELKQQIISDFTPEAMVKAHEVNKKGISIYVDEIAGLFKSFNRYNKGNEEEQYLSTWSGSVISIIRASGDNVRIDNPHINIIGTIQPSVLSQVFTGNKLHNGFIDRFLFVYPESPPKVRWNDKELAESTIAMYMGFIKSLSGYIDKLEDPQMLGLSDEAKIELYEWQNMTPEEYDFNYERGAQTKIEQYVLRLCMLLHVISNYNANVLDDLIERETVKSAVKLAEYYFKNARKVHETFMADPYDLLSLKQKNVCDALPFQFSTSTAIKLVVETKLISRRSLFTFLKDKSLFEKLDRGEYKKKT